MDGMQEADIPNDAYGDLVNELKKDIDAKQPTALLNEDVSNFGVPDPRILICGCGQQKVLALRRISKTFRKFH